MNVHLFDKVTAEGEECWTELSSGMPLAGGFFMVSIGMMAVPFFFFFFFTIARLRDGGECRCRLMSRAHIASSRNET